MVERRVTDGVRIAQLLSSEVDGREDGALGSLSVTNADTDVEGTPAGERAFDVELVEEPFGSVFVHDDRVRIDLVVAHETAAAPAEQAGVDVEADGPDRTVLDIESGAEVKRAVDVLDVLSAELASDD